MTKGLPAMILYKEYRADGQACLHTQRKNKVLNACATFQLKRYGSRTDLRILRLATGRASQPQATIDKKMAPMGAKYFSCIGH